uniref:DUF7848 domain-containing protein n=1 Tax=Streptomyces sp. NBC_01393 TaxID=2903851 RepID=A0AAU3I9H9_9ACTN
MKALYRYVDHEIGLDPAAERDMEEMFCTSCPEGSGCIPIADAQDWAMRHTGSTGHTGFRLQTTNYYRVIRKGDPPPSQAPAVGSRRP